MKCYDVALEIYPDDLSVLVNKLSTFRKQGNFVQALSLCDKILTDNPKYNIILYHKERILFSMEKFDDSILCCNSILKDFPDNSDVLFDKSCNLVMLSKVDDSLDLLEREISQGIQYKVKAKKSKSFEKLTDNSRFKKLVS